MLHAGERARAPCDAPLPVAATATVRVRYTTPVGKRCEEVFRAAADADNHGEFSMQLSYPDSYAAASDDDDGGRLTFAVEYDAGDDFAPVSRIATVDADGGNGAAFRLPTTWMVPAGAAKGSVSGKVHSVLPRFAARVEAAGALVVSAHKGAGASSAILEGADWEVTTTAGGAFEFKAGLFDPGMYTLRVRGAGAGGAVPTLALRGGRCGDDDDGDDCPIFAGAASRQRAAPRDARAHRRLLPVVRRYHARVLR